MKSNSAINILFVINDSEYVSHTSHLIRLITFLSSKHLHQTVYILKPRGPLLDSFLRIPSVRIVYGNRNFFDNTKKILSAIKKEHISLVITKELRSEYILFLVKFLYPKGFAHVTIRPSFGFPHTNVWNTIKNIFYLLSCYLVDYNIGVAKHVAFRIKSLPLINPDKVFSISNSVPLLKIKKQRRRLSPTIIYTGRLVKEKGIWTLVKALENIKYDFQCIILGKGVEKRKLRVYIKQKGLQNKIRLTGFRKNCFPYLKRSDIFVSLSKHTEGLPLSLLEAMNMGCACVVSNIPGHSEIIINNKNGVVVNGDNLPEIVNTITHLLRDYRSRKILGAAARKTIVSKYNDSILFSKYNRLIRELGKRTNIRP